MAPGATVRVGARTAVVVCYTRTPFFTYAAAPGPPVRRDSALVAEFTNALKPYLTELPLLVLGSARPPGRFDPDRPKDVGAEELDGAAWAAAAQAHVQFESAVQAFDSLVAVPRRLLVARPDARERSVLEVRLRALDALQAMAEGDLAHARNALCTASRTRTRPSRSSSPTCTRPPRP